MRSKKLIMLLLSLTMAFSAVSCGNNTTNTRSSENEEETSEETDAEEPDEEASEIKEESALSIGEGRPQPVILHYYASAEDTDGSALIYTNIEGVVMADESRKKYPELAKALEDDYNSLKSYAEDTMEEYKEYAKEDKDYLEYFGGYSLESHPSIIRCDDKVLSLMYDGYSYFGGAHGDYYYTGMNYDVSSGKLLSIKDVFNDTSYLNATIKEKLYEAYPESAEEFEMFDIDETLEMLLNEEDGMSYDYSLGLDGITFQFSPYTISSYASGAESVTIPYTELGDAFNEAYLPDKDTPQISELPTGESSLNLLSLSGDGVTDVLSIYDTYDDDYYNHDIIIDVNGSTYAFTEDHYHFDMEASLFSYPGDKKLLMVTEHAEDGFRKNSYFSISRDNVEEVGTETSFSTWEKDYDKNTYGRYVMVDPYALPLAAHLDLLSTYYGNKTFSLAPDGTLSTEDEYYSVDENPYIQPIISVKDITCDVIDKDGNIVEKDALIPAGESFYIFRTRGYTDGDTETFVDARLSDDRLVRLTLEINNGIYINGINEFDLFETLYYAG